MQKQHLTEHLVHQVLLSTHSLLTLKITLEKSQDPKQDRLEGLSQPEYTVTAHRKSGFFRKHTDRWLCLLQRASLPSAETEEIPSWREELPLGASRLSH